MHIIVAGGGLAGLTAALRAVEFGARVTLLEKGDHPGGSLIYSSGYIWSYKDLRTFRREVPSGDPALQKLVLERLEACLEWLEGLGIPALTRETGNPLTFGTRFNPEQTVATLAEHITTSGGRILMGVALDGLVEGPQGRIGGARVVRVASGETRPESADAVILASGGFAGNPGLVGHYIIGGPGRMRLRAHPWSTGDGFLAALEAGALASAGLDEFYGRNLPAPPANFAPEEFVEVSQLYGRYAVAINRHGERYADEAADWSETSLTRSTVRQPSLRAWYLLDATGLRRRVRDRTVEEMVETAQRVGGTVLQSESLEGLAQRLAERGVPRKNVLRALSEYNTAVAAADHHRPEDPLLTEENKWRATRHGLEARLHDFSADRSVTAREAVRNLVEALRPISQDLGCEAQLEGVLEIVEGGNGADKQRAVLKEHGSLQEVAAYLVAATG